VFRSKLYHLELKKIQVAIFSTRQKRWPVLPARSPQREVHLLLLTNRRCRQVERYWVKPNLQICCSTLNVERKKLACNHLISLQYL